MLEWCENKLTISGQNPFQFLKDCSGTIPCYKNQDGSYDEPRMSKFTFNALVPVPKEVLERGYAMFRRRISLSLEDPLYDKTEVIEGSGKEWQLSNWGTGRDVDTPDLHPEIEEWSVQFENIKEGEISISLHTAWSPPAAWIINAAKRYPQLKFKLAYFGVEEFFVGRVIIENGGVVEQLDFDEDNDDFWNIAGAEFNYGRY